MNNPNTTTTVASAAVAVDPKRSLGAKIASVCFRLPFFLYILVVYTLIELSISNVRASIFSVGPYVMTWVEVIYLLSSMAAMAELLRVSKPGIDNTKEALLMLFVGVGYVVLLVLGIAGIAPLAVFNNTEFLIITGMSAIQVILAFLINARTLKRTIDYTGSEG